MVSHSDLLSDPHWFPVAFDAAANTLTFWHTSRAALSEAAFLDQRAFAADAQFQAMPLNEALGQTPPTARINWILHSAFCCSTLIARALDIPGKSLSLKEPDILMQLANARRMMGSNGLTSQTMDQLETLVLNLLGRRFQAEEAIVIKPTNAANPLVGLALRRSETCLFTVSALQDFLISVIKKGEACRSFIRTLYNIFSLDPAGLSQIPHRQAMTFTDLQVAALVWHFQLQTMAAAGQNAAANIRALDGTRVPADPAPYLRAMVQHFGLDWSDTDIEMQANSDVFRRNSKFDDQSYDANVRSEEAASLLDANREAIDVTLQWAQSINLGGAMKMLPATPLL